MFYVYKNKVKILHNCVKTNLSHNLPRSTSKNSPLTSVLSITLSQTTNFRLVQTVRKKEIAHYA